jgi:hypothetical protein
VLKRDRQQIVYKTAWNNMREDGAHDVCTGRQIFNRYVSINGRCTRNELDPVARVESRSPRSVISHVTFP